MMRSSSNLLGIAAALLVSWVGVACEQPLVGTADGGGARDALGADGGGGVRDAVAQSDTHVESPSPARVDLGAAGGFVILAKSGVSTVPTSAITGNVGVSPAAASSITGFPLTGSDLPEARRNDRGSRGRVRTETSAPAVG